MEATNTNLRVRRGVDCQKESKEEKNRRHGERPGVSHAMHPASMDPQREVSYCQKGLHKGYVSEWNMGQNPQKRRCPFLTKGT